MKGLIKKLSSPSLLLTVVFLFLLILEIFLLYSKVYKSLSTEVENVQSDNIVRLDLNNYKKTLELLDQLNIFSPQNNIRTNPFK